MKPLRLASMKSFTLELGTYRYLLHSCSWMDTFLHFFTLNTWLSIHIFILLLRNPKLWKASQFIQGHSQGYLVNDVWTQAGTRLFSKTPCFYCLFLLATQAQETLCSQLTDEAWAWWMMHVKLDFSPSTLSPWLPELFCGDDIYNRKPTNPSFLLPADVTVWILCSVL